MIKFVLFIFFNILVFNFYGQNTFKMVLSSNGYDEGIAAFRTSSKGYLIVGNTSAYGSGGKDVWVIALDSSANFLWQKTYGSVNNEQATDAFITPDDELIIIGNSMSNNPVSINSFAYRIDIHGYPVLVDYFGGVDWDLATSVALFNDSCFLICGNTYNGPVQGEFSPFVEVISFSGQHLWKSFASGGKIESNLDIVQINSNLVLVSGSVLDSNLDADSAYVKAIDSNGVLLWHSISPATNGAVMAMTAYEDSLIAVTGFHYDSTHQWREPWIGKINQSGHWLLMADEPQGGDSYFSKITVDSANLLIITGMSTAHTNGGKEIYFGGFDNFGYWHKSNILGGTKDDLPGSIFYSHHDSTYLTCGTTKSFDIPYSAIILNQSLHNMQFNPNLVLLMVSNINTAEIQFVKFNIFPNPTDGVVNLNWEIDLKDDLEIDVLNTLGQKVLTQYCKANQNQVQIDISNLPNGIYFFNLRYQNQQIPFQVLKN
jgi:hypothetical protein